MTVSDVFDIRGRGPVVVGRIEAGKVELGQQLWYGGARASRIVQIACIEKFKQLNLKEAAAGPDDVGLELKGISVSEMAINDVLTGI